MMNWKVLVGFGLLLSCTTKTSLKSGELVSVQEITAEEVELVETDTVVVEHVDFYDSLEKVIVDTTSLKGKRDFILRDFHLNSAHTYVSDTLFDVNYDNHEDFIIARYGCCGTGLKYGMEVNLYDEICKCYVHDDQLSKLPNLSVYMDEGKLTSFYLANGAGDCEEYSWIDGTWTLTKSIGVDNNGKSSVWRIEYPLENKEEEVALPYQMVPPKELLTSKHSSYERN